ncbi:hypothetical protein RRG08_042672 [Elysia crispata]|uniref:Uncharacterized protein n=1 Tax=Elysia crispata TaxID=231223 RepID=A0AAE1CK50_9GAST|nr:hypothetical protein RRG08_042672 [Elysia crispata]
MANSGITRLCQEQSRDLPEKIISRTKNYRACIKVVIILLNLPSSSFDRTWYYLGLTEFDSIFSPKGLHDVSTPPPRPVNLARYCRPCPPCPGRRLV